MNDSTSYSTLVVRLDVRDEEKHLPPLSSQAVWFDRRRHLVTHSAMTMLHAAFLPACISPSETWQESVDAISSVDWFVSDFDACLVQFTGPTALVSLLRELAHENVPVISYQQHGTSRPPEYVTPDLYDGPLPSAEEYAFYEREATRGELAGAPDMLHCYECGGFTGREEDAPLRKVTKLGPVVNRADPTQSYVLECGHTTI